MERDKLVIDNQYLVKLEDDDTLPLAVCTLRALHGDFAVVKPDGEQSTQWVPVERVVSETEAGIPAAPEAVPTNVLADDPFKPSDDAPPDTEPDTMWKVDHLGWTACVGGEVRKVLAIDTKKMEARIATPYGPSFVALVNLT